METGKNSKKLLSFFKSEKSGKILFILGIAGILLIFLSTVLTDKPKDNQAASSGASESMGTAVSLEYSEMIENKLTDIIKDITASQNVKVFVTLESGTEYVYANELTQNTDQTEDTKADDSKKVQQKDNTEQKYILVDSPDGGQIALLVTELAPTVKGVVVVCDGGNTEGIKECVKNAVTTALNITSKRVCVTGRS